MNRLTVLQAIIDKIAAQTYLEIGVQEGKIFFQIKAPRKIGVDPQFMFPKKAKLKHLLGLNKGETYELTSTDFFAQVAPELLSAGVDVALIDGLHTYEQALQDVENCLQYLNPHGVIIMHDCNPTSRANAWPVQASIDEVLDLAQRGEVPGWNGCWNGDVWKTIAHLRLANPDVNVFTLDLDWGLGVVAKGHATQPLTGFTTADLATADYSLLESNRTELLDLRPPSYFKTFLETL
jgi:hypothetical protein